MVPLIHVLAVGKVPAVGVAAVVIASLLVIGCLEPVQGTVIVLQGVPVAVIVPVLLIQQQLILLQQILPLHPVLLQGQLLILGHQLRQSLQILVVDLLTGGLAVGIAVAPGEGRRLSGGVQHGLLSLAQVVLGHLLIEGIAVYVIGKVRPVLNFPQSAVQLPLPLGPVVAGPGRLLGLQSLLGPGHRVALDIGFLLKWSCCHQSSSLLLKIMIVGEGLDTLSYDCHWQSYRFLFAARSATLPCTRILCRRF